MEQFNKNAIQLITARGFDKAFTDMLNNPYYPTQEKAYEALESTYKKHFGRRRYSNFNSYRNARNLRLKRK